MTSPIPDGRRAALVAWLEPRRRSILLAMLALLHLVLLEGVGSTVDKLLMVVHVGLFFLWQPFVSKEQRLSLVHLVLIAAVVGVMTVLQGNVTMMVWCMLLGGIIGGKVFVLGSRWNRVFHLAALTYLVGALLLFLLPRLLPPTVALSLPLENLARFGLPFALLAMLVVPAEPDAPDRQVIDFAYSVFVFLLLAVLVLGSLAGMLLTGIGYVESLLAVLLVISGVLLFLGWSWNPRAGFSGLGAFVSRYLFSAGLPLELWVEALATQSPTDVDPDEFVAWACAKLVSEIRGLHGVRWSGETDTGEVGRTSGHVARFSHRGLTFDVYTADSLTPAVVWQFNIQLLLLDEFYLARLRERQLHDIGVMQAIYETGSRLTHDVKNILQSLNSLCAAATDEAARGGTDPEYQALIRRQLPTIARRLGQTLEKLGHAAGSEAADSDAASWWRGLQDSFAGRGIVFAKSGDLSGRLLPASLFSAAAENLVQNALDKRSMQPAMNVAVALSVDAGGVVLEVSDDGEPIPERLAERLGKGPVSSENGLGVGLFQIARLAAAAGYRLELAANLPGQVCFRLSQATSAG